MNNIITGFNKETKLVTVGDVETTKIEWLWHGKIPLGKLTLLFGDPGLGKTTIALDLAARVTTGSSLPDKSGPAPQGDVIFISCEDGIGDTLRPRLEAQKADVSRIHILSFVKDEERRTLSSSQRNFSIGSDLELLEEAIDTFPSTKLIVIDPISAFLGGGFDANSQTEVRSALGPLAELASEKEVAILLIGHQNKNQQADTIYRVSGSMAFFAVVRVVLMVTPSKDDPEKHLFRSIKNNLYDNHQGLAYHMESLPPDNAVAVIDWDPEPINCEGSYVGDMQPREGSIDIAKNMLEEMLSAGPVYSKEIRNAAEQKGISWATIRRAKNLLGVIQYPDGYQGGWKSKLPDQVDTIKAESQNDNDSSGMQKPSELLKGTPTDMSNSVFLEKELKETRKKESPF